MTDVAAQQTPPRHSIARTPHLMDQVGLVAWRSVRAVSRRPANIVPPVFFPLMLLAVNSAGLGSATEIPGFPADSYLDFALVIPFMQGALFATTTSGLSLGRDIEEGFLDRLALTPLSGTGLIIGQLAGSAAIGLFSACIYIAVGLIAGVHFASGIAGMALLIVMALATCVAFAATGAFLALRAGTSESVQGLFPMFFAALFMSTMLMPLDLILSDWFRVVATINPVSYLINAMRSLVITGWDVQTLLVGAGVAASMIFVALFGCSRALRTRLTRT